MSVFLPRKSNSNIYSLVDIGNVGEQLGFKDVQETYDDVKAFIPQKEGAGGLNVQVNGAELTTGYAQLKSGIFVKQYVADDAAIENKPYVPPTTQMILSFGK